MIRASLMVLLSCAAFGQSAPAVRTFEVASVKPHEGPMYRLGVTTSGQRLTADACNVLMLVMYAYHVKNFQLAGTAPLFKEDNTRWDIVAKSEGDTAPTRDEFRQMLRSLLAERFQLKVHRETREMPVYALVVGKNGAKFKESSPDADPTQHYSIKGRNDVTTLPKATMEDVADAIDYTAMLDRPVVDRTGLAGTYDIKLIYTPNTRANREGEPDLNDISVFQAVEEQLGLKLEAQNAPVEMLVAIFETVIVSPVISPVYSTV